MTFACQAIIFDLDGVLVDSNPIAERHWERWAERHGLPFDEIAQIHHGRPTVETIRRVAPHLNAEYEARLKETAEADDTNGLTAYSGAAVLLATLPTERWAIATSGTRRTATSRLAHVGLPVPSVFITADDVEHGKPAPDPYLLAAERLGVEPAACVVVEDAPSGIASARAAGSLVIAVASTNKPVMLTNADVVVPELSALHVEVNSDGLVVQVT